MTIPEGFREFLGVDAGDEILVVGAAVCVEIWKVEKWVDYVNENIGDFHQLFDGLSD